MKLDKLERYQHIHPNCPYISMERIERYERSDQSSNLCRDAKCTLSQAVRQLTFNQRINGSIPLECTKYSLSTMGMQLTLNQWIKGSNPLGSTKKVL